MPSHSRLKAKPLRQWVAVQLRGLALRVSGSSPGSRRGSSRKTSNGPSGAGRSSGDSPPGIEARGLLISLARLHKREAKRAVALGKLSKDLLRLGFPKAARRMGRLSFGHWRRSRGLAAEIRFGFPSTREKDRIRAA